MKQKADETEILKEIRRDYIETVICGIAYIALILFKADRVMIAISIGPLVAISFDINRLLYMLDDRTEISCTSAKVTASIATLSIVTCGVLFAFRVKLYVVFLMTYAALTIRQMIDIIE